MTFHLEPERHKDYTNERDKLRAQENGSTDRKLTGNRLKSGPKWTKNGLENGDPWKGVWKQDKVIFYTKSCLSDFLFDKDWIHFYSQGQKSQWCQWQMPLGFNFVTTIRWLSPFLRRVRIKVLDVESIWIVVQLPCSSKLLFSPGIRYFCRCIYMNILVHLKTLYKPKILLCFNVRFMKPLGNYYISSMAIICLGNLRGFDLMIRLFENGSNLYNRYISFWYDALHDEDVKKRCEVIFFKLAISSSNWRWPDVICSKISLIAVAVFEAWRK